VTRLCGRLTLGLGIDLAAQQHGQPGQVQPEDQDHHARERAVGLAVGAEPGHIEGEAKRGQQEDGGAH
jgi:hypothetical protein